MNRTTARLAASALAGAALLASLTACSSSTPDTDPTPSPTTTTAKSGALSCSDGRAVITQDDDEVRLDSSCTSLEVRADHAQVVAGADLESITVSGKLNYIRTQGVGTVTFDTASEGNRVVTSATPETDDQGRANMVGPAPEKQ